MLNKYKRERIRRAYWRKVSNGSLKKKRAVIVPSQRLSSIRSTICPCSNAIRSDALRFIPADLFAMNNYWARRWMP